MISFREVELDDAEKILNWRTSDRVTEFMSSDMKYDLDAQKRWLSLSFNKQTYYHWIVQYGGEDVGLLNFVDWDIEAKVTSWGFYLGEDAALGIGGLVPPYFYNFAFDILGVEKIQAEVFYNNTKVINLHLQQGYKFDPKRDHVLCKDSREILMVCMTLDRSAFMKSTFSRLRRNLPITRWNACPL